MLRQLSRQLATATALAFVGSSLAGTVVTLPSALAESGLTPDVSARGAGALSAEDVARLQTPVVAGQADLAVAASVAGTAPVQVVALAPAAAAAAPGAAAAGTAAPAPATRSADSMGIPGPMIDAYKKAAEQTNQRKPGCGMDWTLLAAIGKVESDHAQGGKIDSNGTMTVKFAGPPTKYGTAKGPMQFLDSSWVGEGQDGNGDGVKDVYNIHDSALAAGIYLCSEGGGPMTNPKALHDALFSYNHAEWYVQKVLTIRNGYAGGVVATTTAPLPATPIVPPTSSVGTPAAPKNGGATGGGEKPSDQPVTAPVERPEIRPTPTPEVTPEPGKTVPAQPAPEPTLKSGADATS